MFLHGFLGTLNDWKPLVAYLPGHLSIGIDLPGHGKSPFQKPFDIPFSSFHLVGYSLGGRIALEWAKNHRKKLLSLTLLSTHPGLRSKREKIFRMQSDRKWAEKLLKEPIDTFLEHWYNQSVFGSFRPDFSTRRKQNREELAKALLSFSLARQNYFEVKGALVGEYDQKFLEVCKDPVIIEKAGHCIHLENPKKTAEAIIKNLEGP